MLRGCTPLGRFVREPEEAFMCMVLCSGAFSSAGWHELLFCQGSPAQRQRGLKKG
jgi:hypothetical protein